MNQVKTTNAQDMFCSANRRNSGMAAPRTCMKCGVGPCHYKVSEAPAQAVSQAPFKWPNGCDSTIPRALRHLANHPRPSGGEEKFNAAHLYQLAGEMEAAVQKINAQQLVDSTPTRTDQEIVDQTDDLARELAALDGYSLDGKFYSNSATRAKHYWALACTAQAHLTNTDPCDALSALEDEQASAAPGSVQDHVVREVVNKLCDIAKEHHDGEQLRVRLCAAIEPLIK